MATAAPAAAGSPDEFWNSIEECLDFWTYIDLLEYIDSYQVGLSFQTAKICFYSETIIKSDKMFPRKTFW